MIYLTNQVAQSNFTIGSHVWVEDPEAAWIDGEVEEVNNEDIKITCTSGRTVSAPSQNQYKFIALEIWISCLWCKNV